MASIHTRRRRRRRRRRRVLPHFVSCITFFPSPFSFSFAHFLSSFVSFALLSGSGPSTDTSDHRPKKFTCSLVATVPDGRRGIKWKTGGCDRPLAKKGREEAVVAAFLVCQSVQACTSRQSRSRHHQTTNPVRSGPFRSTVFKLSTNRLSPVDQVKPNPALRPSAPNGPLLLSSSRLVIFRFFLILPIRVFIFFASLQQIIHFTFERLDQ